MSARMAKASPRAKSVASKSSAGKKMARSASAGSEASASSPTTDRKAGSSKVARHVDAKVAARNSALNAMGGVKVDVFVRVRPILEREKNEDKTVIADTETHEIVLEDPAGKPAKYKYDKVYGPESSQEDVYEDAVAPIVEQVARGLSCAIFAYGQTGTGKTFTMRGNLDGKEENFGIIQRSITNLFRRLEEHEYENIRVKVSFLEIYMEELEDLFKDPPPVSLHKKKVKSKLMLVDAPERGCMCKGLDEVPVTDVSQVMKLLYDAEKRCKFAETKMNKFSNRAHRIFTVTANFKRYEKDVTTTLTFVDLAGSEDISRSGATGLTAREAQSINKSLLTLGRVINALACNEKHIPYRDSKLTRLLSEALGGVCKTSFIACVSPCANSVMESNSTLRYAERAMEALNISQFPRWKQDEIVIDGLTRRVQQLVDDISSISKIHKEEMTLMKNENSALVEQNRNLRERHHKMSRKIEKLEARKQQLKAGLTLMTAERDRLHAQKEALREELLETRKERDGYLHDRAVLSTVLSSVRSMRDKLLDTHSDTERSLTSDANDLKRVIEGAVKDIEELHTEVARKKALSTANENAADDFRDRMSGKLRALVQAESEFKAAQDDKHSALNGTLSTMRNNRQQETGTLRNDLTKLSANATEILADITMQGMEIETALKTRIKNRLDDDETHKDDLLVAVKKLNTNITNRMEQLRAHATTLGESMGTWAEKMKLKLDESNSSATQHNQQINSHVAAIQAHLEGASAAQLEHFSDHQKALTTYLDTEKETMAKESTELIDNINNYVQRMMTDFTRVTNRRTEKAVAGFKQTCESLADETKDLKAHQTSEHTSLTTKSDDWVAAFGKSIDEGLRSNTASQFTSAGLLKQAVDVSKETDTDMGAGKESLTKISDDFLARATKAAGDATSTAEANRQATEKLTANGTQNLQTQAETLRAKCQSHLDQFTSTADSMDGQFKDTIGHVRTTTDDVTDGLFDSEADAVAYVDKEIQRDTQAAPPEKDYVYPQEYQATDEYFEVLRETKKDWTREHKLREGEATAGKGVDYPGVQGEDDGTGLLETTVDKPPKPDHAALMEEAAHESEPDDYETDSNGLSDLESSDEDEEEMAAANGNAV